MSILRSKPSALALVSSLQSQSSWKVNHYPNLKSFTTSNRYSCICSVFISFTSVVSLFIVRNFFIFYYKDVPLSHSIIHMDCLQIMRKFQKVQRFWTNLWDSASDVSLNFCILNLMLPRDQSVNMEKNVFSPKNKNCCMCCTLFHCTFR